MRNRALSLLLLSACAHQELSPAFARTTPVPAASPSPSSEPAATIVEDAAPPAPLSAEDLLANEVADLRARRLKSKVTILHLDSASFEARTKGLPATKETLATYVAFGFVRHDPHATSVSAHSNFLGLYDFTTHSLWLRASMSDETTRGVLVHELVHAIQDQNFGITSDDDDDVDRALARKSLYEGDAMLVREIYAAKKSRENVRDRLDRALLILRTNPRAHLAIGLGIPEAKLNEPRFAETLSTYVDGMIFVTKLYLDGGFARVDEAYTDPPATTEQILHPEKFLAHERAIDVLTPDVDKGHVKITDGTLGETRIRLLLGRCAEKHLGVVAGSGWGGDRYVIEVNAKNPNELALAWSTVWDSDRDAIRFETALRHVAKNCWPSANRGGYFIGAKQTLTRDGPRVTYTRGL